MSIAIEPTPPVAPVTITGPAPGFRPSCSIRVTARPAVKPAVPSAIASNRLMPFGIGTTQSALMRAYSA